MSSNAPANPVTTFAPLIPRTVLFGNPSVLSPSLSPSGRQVAYLAPHGGVLNIWVGEIDKKDFRPITDRRERGIYSYAWAADGRHLLFSADHEGDENTHLFAVDTRTGECRDLTPFPGVQARLIGIERRAPEHVLVGLNLASRRVHDAYRLHVPTGELTLAARNDGFGQWFADADLRVRCAVVWGSEGGFEVLVRDDEAAAWRSLCRLRHTDAAVSRPFAFSGDGRRLLMLSAADANATRLVEIELASGETTVVYEDPHYDVIGVGLQPGTRRPDLVVVRRERNHLEALDDALSGDLARLRRLGRGDVSLLGRADADDTWLVQLNVDDGPSAYYAYDRRTGGADLLFTHHPELERYRLARVEPFSFTARDGLVINGYLTFPPGLPRRELPAVVAVHGGPQTRDIWGFRGESQWLANRGYLCVQVNFRGSTGYGKEFINAGDREWGGRMQDDLVDAVRHVVDAGYADPARLAIYGASYGGYAALVGAAFTPDLFRCAVAVAAPANLQTFLRSIPVHLEALTRQIYRRVGNPDTEAEFVWSRSPLSRVDQIRVPMLIAQGANDPRVPRGEAEQLVAALRERGVPHEYLLFGDEGHTFAKPENRLAFYAAAERFLAEHLGGRYEAAAGA